MSAPPRVITIPAPQAPLAVPTRRAGGLWAIISTLALMAFIFVGVATIFDRAAYWISTFRLRSDTILEDDFSRLKNAQWGLAMAVQALREEHEAGRGGLTFAFTQAEIAFYSGLPFISYVDETALPFFQAPSRESLWQALRARGIRFVLQPGYPLAEVTNSAFDALLSDPSLTQIVFSRDGHRLIRLRDQPMAFDASLLASGGGDAAFQTSDWTATSYRGGSLNAGLVVSEHGLLVNVPRRPIEDRQRWDYLRRGDIANGGVPAFEAPPGVSTLSIDLTGRGRFDLFVVLPSQGGNFVETMIWTGVLLGERRTISGQFELRDRAAPVGFVLRSYRVEPYLVHGWRAETAALPAPTESRPATSRRFVYANAISAETAALSALTNSGHARATLVVDGIAAFNLSYFCMDEREVAETVEATRGANSVITLQCWPRAVTFQGSSETTPPTVRIVMSWSDGSTVTSRRLSPILD